MMITTTTTIRTIDNSDNDNNNNQIILQGPGEYKPFRFVDDLRNTKDEPRP